MDITDGSELVIINEQNGDAVLIARINAAIVSGALLFKLDWEGNLLTPLSKMRQANLSAYQAGLVGRASFDSSQEIQTFIDAQNLSIDSMAAVLLLPMTKPKAFKRVS